MTQTFATNSDNDIFLDSSGNLAVLTAIPAVAQACKNATLVELGEEVFAVNQGIPNFETVWVGVPSIRVWQAYIINTLQSVDGVQKVTDLKLGSQTGTLSYIANITTDFGDTTVTV